MWLPLVKFKIEIIWSDILWYFSLLESPCIVMSTEMNLTEIWTNPGLRSIHVTSGIHILMTDHPEIGRMTSKEVTGGCGQAMPHHLHLH